MRLLQIEHPDGRGPGVFGDVATLERWPAWTAPPPADADAYDALVLFGASTNVVDAERERWLRDELAWLRERLAAGVPALGVCFGAQLLAAALGAEVTRSDPPEIGWTEVALTEAGRDDPVLSTMGERFTACQWHSWTFAVPADATLLATSAACPQAFRHGDVWGVQFHPEVDRPTLERWNADWRSDPDATGPVELEPLPAWNVQGRRLFAAFLDALV